MHSRINAEEDAIPEDFRPFLVHSVSLAALQAGVCSRIDLLEGDGQLVTLAEYNRVHPLSPETLRALFPAAAEFSRHREVGLESGRAAGAVRLWRLQARDEGDRPHGKPRPPVRLQRKLSSSARMFPVIGP